MFFTQEDYKKIEQWLLRNSIKDTEFQESLPVKGNEWITIIQDGYNRKVRLVDFVKAIHELGVQDFLNVTDNYHVRNIDLEKAIRTIPFKARKEGQVITFLNKENKWEIYQFIGALNQWNNPELWKNVISSSTTVIDSYLPDEEDLTLKDSTKGQVISLKDREYNEDNPNGMGYIILRKNKPFKQQITKANTIYEIRYDFDLNGEEVTIPEGCVLKFEGGSLRNGSVIGNKTKITGNPLFEVLIYGTWTNNEFMSSWVVQTADTDKYTNIIESILQLNCIFILDCNITLNGLKTINADNICIKGNNHTITNLYIKVKESVNISDTSLICDSEIDHIIRIVEEGNLIINNVKIKSNTSKYAIRTDKLNVCQINLCEITGIRNYGIRIDGETVNANIKNCYIHDIGNNESVDNVRANIVGLIVGSTNVRCPYAHIENVIVENVQCGYANGNDFGEAHGISVYGDYSIIEGCTVKNIYTLIDGVISDSGTDCEAIYSKGNNIIIHNNNVIYANGGNSDGAITAKDGDNVKITNNTIYVKYGTAVVITENYCEIKNNLIVCEGDAKVGIRAYTYEGNHIKGNVIKGNYIKCINRNYGNNCAAIVGSNCDNYYIEENKVEEFPVFSRCYDNFTDSKTSIFYKGNEFTVSNIDYIEELESIQMIYSTYNSTMANIFIANKFNLNGIRINIIYRGQQDYSRVEFINNEFNFNVFTGENPITDGGKCVFNRAFTGISKFDDNTIWLDNESLVNLLTLSNGYAKNNKIEGNVNKLPKIEGTVLSNNRIYRAKSYGEDSDKPSQKITIGDSFFNTTENRPVYWNGSDWVKANGTSLSLKEKGTTPQRPIGVNDGFEYYDTTIRQPIYWNESRQGWINADGYAAGVRSGVTQRRTELTEYLIGLDTGLQFFDSTLGKTVVWNGATWINVDGSALE